MALRYSTGDPSINPPKTMFQLSGVHFKGGWFKEGGYKGSLGNLTGTYLREHWRELGISRLSTPLGAPAHKDTTNP